MTICDTLEAYLRKKEDVFYNAEYYCNGCEHAGFFLTRQIKPIQSSPGIFIHSVEYYVTCDFHVKNFLLAQNSYRSDDCVEMDEEGDSVSVIRWCGQKTKPQKGSGKNGELETE